MAYQDKEDRFSLNVRDIIYRFESHSADLFKTPEFQAAFQKLKDLCWDNKEFWEEIGRSESRWNSWDEPDEKHMRYMLENLSGRMEWLEHQLTKG